MKPEMRVTAVCLNKGAWLPCLLAFLLLTAAQPPGAWAQKSARVLHRNIAQLVDKADVIFRGEVTSAYVEPHPTRKIRTVVVTLKVQEVLKGQVGTEYTFRQYLWDPRDTRSKLDYGPGQQYVLLMRNPNPDGLSSPSGMEQGRFRLTTDAAGNVTATNAYDNVGLLRQVDQTNPAFKTNLDPATSARMAQHLRGPITYQDLKNLILSAVAASN